MRKCATKEQKSFILSKIDSKRSHHGHTTLKKRQVNVENIDSTYSNMVCTHSTCSYKHYFHIRGTEIKIRES